MTSLGESLPRLLAGRGIDTAFGIPGIHNVEMWRGLPGSGLRAFTPRHEQGAGFMAEGFARASGRPAACLVITGPGLTNIATPMGQALADSIPMLVLSSVNARDPRGPVLGRLHELPDQAALGGAVARWSARAEAPSDLTRLLDRAMATFAAERPGPVHIEIPLDLLGGPSDAPRPPAPVPASPAPGAGDVAAAAALLSAAVRPVVVLGGGAVGLGARLATELAERLGAAVLLTSNARGLLPAGHPLLAGGTLAAPGMRALLAGADAILALGTEFGPTDWEYYDEPPLRFGGPLIRVDIDDAALSRPPGPALAVRCAAAAFARALLASLPDGTRPGPGLAPLRAAAPAHYEPRILRHAALLRSVWQVLPGVPLIGDSTEPAYAGLVLAEPPGPRQWWCAATGFGTLGYALPAAIGAALATGGPAVALAGDGGALYTIAELAAAAEARLPVILLVWNNRGYGEIRHAMQARQIAPAGVDLSPVDFALLARGFGAEYASARDLAELAPCLRAAALRPGPTVIELREADWRF